MKIKQRMAPVLSSIAVVTSFFFAPKFILSTEALYLPLSSKPKALQQLPSHRSIRLERSSPIFLSNKEIEMSATKEVDKKSSLADNASSILDIILTKIGSTTSTVVAGTFFIVLCYKRDALMVSFFIGAISNAIFGKILKKVLKIDRPKIDNNNDSTTASRPEVEQPNDNGMPSSHAMSLGFICTFVALMIPITTIPMLAYALISLIYRVQVNLHTIDQIIVGAALGTLDGTVWWHLCINGFRGFNVLDFVSSSGIMNEYGLLPWYVLVIPALIGAIVVGSVERRIGKFLRNTRKLDIKEE